MPSVRRSLHGISIGQTKTTPFKYSNFGIACGAGHINKKVGAREHLRSVSARYDEGRAAMPGTWPDQNKTQVAYSHANSVGQRENRSRFIVGTRSAFWFWHHCLKNWHDVQVLGASVRAHPPPHTPTAISTLQNLVRSSLRNTLTVNYLQCVSIYSFFFKSSPFVLAWQSRMFAIFPRLKYKVGPHQN
jgi:hypothetical protein